MLGIAKPSKGRFFAAFLTFCPPLLSPPPGITEVMPIDLSNVQTATITYKNSSLDLALVKDIFVHYGFNGWNLVTSGPGSGYDFNLGNSSYYIHSKMTYRDDLSAYALEIPIPHGARALHYAICWDQCGAGQWDNNNARDFSWPIVFPYIGPILSWDENTAADSGMVVSFENSWRSSAWLEYWQENGQREKILSANTLTHRFTLTNLTPDTRYYYRIGIEDDVRVSAEYTFKTAKRPSTNAEFSFLLLGDPQDNGDTGQSAKAFRKILTEHDDIDFIVATGDLTYNDNPGLWWTFFDAAKALISSYAFMPAVGNHDTPGVDSHPNTSSFMRYFKLPWAGAGRPYYEFRYGNAQFFAMNSEIPSELGEESGRQYRWLSQKLNGTRPAWTFAFWHIPPFNIGARHWQQRRFFRSTAKLLDGQVDWQFAGHEHLYQRTYPLRFEHGRPMIKDEFGLGSEKGGGYLVTPSAGVEPSTKILRADEAGGEERRFFAKPDVSWRAAEVPQVIGFVRIDIKARDFKLTTYGFDPTNISYGFFNVLDEIIYSK